MQDIVFDVYKEKSVKSCTIEKRFSVAKKLENVFTC